MKNTRMFLLILFLMGNLFSVQLLFAGEQNPGISIYPIKINDSRAVYLTKENFHCAADGVGDDAPAIQSAIDLVREQSGEGIVFIPEGIYRLGKTILLWKGIRLIGYGASRPVFLLGDNTPGFQEGERKYMVHFCSHPNDSYGAPQPGSRGTPDFQDADFNTMYSGIQNINFEIGNGNQAAIAVRYHVAQVCALSYIDFNIGNGLGAVEDMGNIIENCTFRGGNWAIKTGVSAPGWPCSVLDCDFTGQREVSIITDNARMTIIRARFKNAPIGILLPSNEQLFVKDSWFEDIDNSAIVLKKYACDAVQVNLDNVKFSNLPYSVRFQGRVQGVPSIGEGQMDIESPSPMFVMKSFSHGIHITNTKENTINRSFKTEFEQFPIKTLGNFIQEDIAGLPSQKKWINIADLGAKGDGLTDCTDIFINAIAKYEVIYIPMGSYILSNTVTLRKETSLLGLHPNKTRFILKDGTPGFEDPKNSKPLFVTPKNGSNIISGLGFDLGVNPGAIGIKWMSGIHSCLKDCVFKGQSHGTSGVGNKHSIWVTNGGGGVFKNLWIFDTRTKLPFYISNTETPGSIYEISVEHHSEIEVKLEKVQNWSFYALQIEEYRGCEKTLGVLMDECRNINFVNFRSHRTSGVWEPYPTAMLLRNSNNIVIRGCFIGGFLFPFDNVVVDENSGLSVPLKLFTKLEIQ